MAELWVTSDLHFGHRTVAELRGFANVDAHDAELIRNITDVVKPDDQVIFCGDLVSSNSKPGLEIVKELPGEWHAILGNHDDAHPLNTNAHRKQRKWLEAFASVQTMMKRKVHGRTVMFSHFPYSADHTSTSRYMEYRLPHFENRLLVHGHLHSKERYTSRTELHIGVDAWDLAPVPFQVIQDWVQGVIENEQEALAYAGDGSFS